MAPAIRRPRCGWMMIVFLVAARWISTSYVPPAWWQQGFGRKRPDSEAEGRLLPALAELFMPKMPIWEAFRSFPAPEKWCGKYLEPDLAVYGALRQKDGALFMEYDGHPAHGERLGRDKYKNRALLSFAPPGSRDPNQPLP